MPMRLFWLMHGNISRLLAETNIRDLQVSAATQGGGEAVVKLQEHLTIEFGEPFKANPLAAERDDAGFEALKNLAV